MKSRMRLLCNFGSLLKGKRHLQVKKTIVPMGICTRRVQGNFLQVDAKLPIPCTNRGFI